MKETFNSIFSLFSKLLNDYVPATFECFLLKIYSQFITGFNLITNTLRINNER